MFPCLRKCACFGMFLITFAFVAEGVVREQSLIARWSFDEGNGSVAVDSTGGGLDLLLSANAKWGSIDVNNTLMGFMTIFSLSL